MIERPPQTPRATLVIGRTNPDGTSRTRFRGVALSGVASFALGVAILMLAGCGGDGSGTLDGPPAVPASGAVLNWDAPLTSVDGTQLFDLAGFKIYYGTTSPISKTNSQNIDVGNATAYTFDGLPAGTYYFAVAAYDLLNNESDLSDATTKTITGS